MDVTDITESAPCRNNEVIRLELCSVLDHSSLWEVSKMLHAKHASKRRSRPKAVTVLGVAGGLSLAGGASGAASDSACDTLTQNAAPVITLGEEEISDVSLATFFVDHENAGARRPGLQLTQRTRSRPRQGCGGCAADCGGGGSTCCASCASGGGVDGY